LICSLGEVEKINTLRFLLTNNLLRNELGTGHVALVIRTNLVNHMWNIESTNGLVVEFDRSTNVVVQWNAHLWSKEFGTLHHGEKLDLYLELINPKKTGRNKFTFSVIADDRTLWKWTDEDRACFPDSRSP